MRPLQKKFLFTAIAGAISWVAFTHFSLWVGLYITGVLFALSTTPLYASRDLAYEGLRTSWSLPGGRAHAIRIVLAIAFVIVSLIVNIARRIS